MNLDLIQVALSVYGLKETPGKADNPIIIQMAKDAGFEHDYLHDDIAWCSMFANWVAFKAGYERSKKLNARSWLDVGEPIEEKDLQTGDAVILWRDAPAGPFGHISFYINHLSENWLNLLGGNQNNMISIGAFDKHRVLGYRRLKKIA